MGNSHHKTIFKWSSTEEQHTFSWNRFIAVERRRRRRQDLANCCRQTTAFLFSHVGLSAMIVAYTVMGGFLFRALEGPFEKEEKNRVAEVKARLIGEILQAADSIDCFADNGRMLFVRSLFQASKPDRDVETFKSSISSNINGSTSTESFSYKNSQFPSIGIPPRRPFNLGRRIYTRENHQSKSRLFNKSAFNSTLHQKFKTFALEILRAIKESGWNGQDDMEEASMQWSHAGAILYAITVITTIGYGHIAPKTDWGRIVTIIYALIGIPLTFLYLSNIGNFLADCFRIFYKRVCCDVFCCKKCERQRKRERLKLRKQRIQAIQRSLVMKAAMNTLMVDSGRTGAMPYDRLKSVIGFPTEDGYDSDAALRQWVARDNRRALSCEKRNCVGPQHYPLEEKEYALSIYHKAFHSESSLTSTGLESERRPRRKKVHRTNFKGVTIVEPRSPKKEISSKRPAFKQLDRSYVSYSPTQNESKYIRFSPINEGECCDILSEGTVKFNRNKLDEAATNLWRIRRDSVFQSDSLLMANKQASAADNECSKSLKGSDKTGRVLKKSLSVRFFHKSEKPQDPGNDTSRRKLRFPSRPFFKQTLKLSRKSPGSSERNFFSWQKHKRKEDDEERAKENWQKLIAYSKQLSEENRRLTNEKQHTSNPYYNSLPLKAENILRNRQLQNEETILKYQHEESTQEAQGNGKTKESQSRHHSNKKTTDLTSSLHIREKVSKRSTPSRAKREGELSLAPTQKNKSKRQTSKSFPDKSNAVGQISTPGVKHIDSKNSIESYVTAICQSLSSIGEEDATAAKLTTVVRSSERSKTRSCNDAREAKKMTGEKQSGADANRKPKAGSSKKRKTFNKEKHSKTVIVQNAIGRSISNDNCSRLPRFHFPTTTSTLDQPQISYLGNSLPSPCALQGTEQEVDEDDDCSKVTVPIYICLILIGGYLFAGSALFSFWEGWNTITGSYFCFITLSTIGFGDIVPGTGVNDWASQAKLVLCTLWLALGLSLLAMCFNLMQEEVKERCRKLGVKLGLLKDDSKPMYE